MTETFIFPFFSLFVQQDVLYYEQLKSYVLQHDLLVDNLLYKVLNIFAIQYLFHVVLILC